MASLGRFILYDKDGNPITEPFGEPIIPPRVATNNESDGWQGFLKGCRKFVINASDLYPVDEKPEIEAAILYYYRRGKKYFFKMPNGVRLTIEVAEIVPDLKHYGLYPAKFKLR